MHVDAGDPETRPAVRAAFPSVAVSRRRAASGRAVGETVFCGKRLPGLWRVSTTTAIQSIRDFFDSVGQLFDRDPSAGMLAAGAIVHDGEVSPDRSGSAAWTADFVGCGCAYRRAAFLETDGYVALPLPYGVEEADLTLQLHARGWRILRSDLLRVRHATALDHHRAPEITAASVSNLARLAMLRYPSSLWPYAALQIANRVTWLLRNGRRAGLASGLADIPRAVLDHRHARSPVTPNGQAGRALGARPNRLDASRTGSAASLVCASIRHSAGTGSAWTTWPRWSPTSGRRLARPRPALVGAWLRASIPSS